MRKFMCLITMQWPIIHPVKRTLESSRREADRACSLEQVHIGTRILSYIAHRLGRQGLQLLAVHQVYILPVCVQLHTASALSALATMLSIARALGFVTMLRVVTSLNCH